jgi:hypothetical protein
VNLDFFNIPQIHEVTQQTPSGAYLILRKIEPNAVQLVRVSQDESSELRTFGARTLKRIQDAGYVLREPPVFLDVQSTNVLVEKSFYSAIFDRV